MVTQVAPINALSLLVDRSLRLISDTPIGKSLTLDRVSLDQLRAFIATVDEGSFSGAARKLLRAQSVISDMVANLEGQIGVALFDRTGRYPKLTAQGTVLLGDARSIVTGVDFMKARAKGMSSGLEAELAVVVEGLFPIETITHVAKQFREHFPGTPLRLYVDALGGVLQPVLDGRARALASHWSGRDDFCRT